MNRILILLTALLLLDSTPVESSYEFDPISGVGAFSSEHRQQYLLGVCQHTGRSPDGACAIAVASDGAWGADYGPTIDLAKSRAIHACKSVSSDPASCKIVDLNGQSDFIKKFVWCATAGYVLKVPESSCKHRHGKSFSTKSQAQAEHQRLKKQTTTASTSGPKSVWCANRYRAFQTSSDYSKRHKYVKCFATKTQAQAEHQRLKNQSATVQPEPDSQPTQTAVVDNSALELEFWQSIKDSNDPDMYREYLRQFPSGVYAGLAKIKIQKLSGSTTSVAQASIPNLDYGQYHALVIGNNNYRHLSDLETAINDANAIGRVLKENYGFSVKVLTNATRTDILDTFSQYRKKVSAKDNLLIYFAGHGHLDREMDEGYWLPIDAVEDSFTNWISNSSIVSSVRAMEAKHVMVVADSCFSGTLVRAVKITPRTPGSLQKFVNRKARTALTSGGIEPVTDVGGGQHSVFARALLSLLEQNPGVMNGQELFVALRRQVQLNADQIPEYGDIRKAGHDGGDFLFVRR